MKKTLLPTLFTILLMTSFVLPVSAQDVAPSTGVAVAVAEDGVHVSWAVPTGEVSAAALDTLLPTTRHGGYDLPMQSITVALPEGVAPAVSIQRLETTRFTGTLAPGEAELPPALDWTPAPNAGPAEPVALPTAPIFVLREGTVRGQHIAVVAVSPLFEENGIVQVATALVATIPGAIPTSALPANDAAVASQVAATPQEVVEIATNGAATQNGFKLIVSTPGIQEVLFSALGSVADSSKLRLTHRGQNVAMQVLGDRLRFYAPTVGDRWNTTSIYWLTFDRTSEPRMATPGAAPAAGAGQAFERGTWRDNKVYDSMTPGPDQDRWFHAAMTVLPDAPSTAQPAALATIATALPVAAGQGVYTASVSVAGAIPTQYCQSGADGYKLRFEALDSASKVLDTQTSGWNPAPYDGTRCQLQEDWDITWSTIAVPAKVRLTLVASGLAGYQTSIRLDSVHWERPVSLNFANQGGDFWTRSGAASFALGGIPAAPTLYDVTEPLAPSIIPIGSGGFNQTATASERHYVLANTAALAKPAVVAHSPVSFGNVKAANAIYIGPAQFRAGLQPLISLRSTQGYTPLFVDVQAIYDLYGDGYASAQAIRDFLRAQSDWQNPARTISVVLASDGTYDPYNYEAKVVSGRTFAIPPYMADVDPYIHETVCEPCIAQLNGDDPITGDDPQAVDPKSNFFAADIWLGRFPVRTETELTDMVSKIVAYETTGSNFDGWRTKHLFLADNFIKSINAANEASIDPAGDFAAYSDELIASFGYGIYGQRVYYDPAPTRRVTYTSMASTATYPTVDRSPAEPWRLNSTAAARQSAIDNINNGSGLVVYNGHSNHWQYAILENQNGDTPLLSIADIGLLTSSNKPFIGLSMTCYTSQFARPANEGTLDELFVRKPNGGAVAMWGPAGLTVAHGHDYLQKGFITKLRTSAPYSQRVGDLVEAGYTSLLTSPLSSALDALKTFLVLGDPLTKVRISGGGSEPLFLPSVQR